MGITRCDVEVLTKLYKAGVPFGRSVTIGRQNVLASREEILELLRGVGVPQERLSAFETAELTYGEPIFTALGASSVDSVDYSDFEGATVVHDLNATLPDALKERFDLLFDGGTIEHVFDTPAVLKNYMGMLALNGHLCISTMANNQCGHGFYQYSPEFFFRVLSEDNGFENPKVYLYEIYPRVAFMTRGLRGVRDPKVLGERTLLDAGAPLSIVAVGQRTKIVPLFAKPPLQSDYSAAWEAGSMAELKKKQKVAPSRFGKIRGLVASLDMSMPRLMCAMRTITNPLKNEHRFFSEGS